MDRNDADIQRDLEQKEALSERAIHREQANALTCEEYDYAPEDHDFAGQLMIDGLPEWCTAFGRDAHEGLSDTHVYVTTFSWGIPLAPKGWEKVAHYMHSGETECWCGHTIETEHEHEWGHEAAGSNGWPACATCVSLREDDDNDTEHGHPNCPLCDGDGMIYIGDGYCEVVYRAWKYDVWPEEGKEARREIIEAFADALHCSAWADCEERGGRTPKGEIRGNTDPCTLSAVRTAIKAVREIERKQGKKVSQLYLEALYAHQVECNRVVLPRRAYCSNSDPDTFGWYLGMQWLGHGVSWADDHPELGWHPGHGEFHYWHPSEYGASAEDWHDPEMSEVVSDIED